MALGPLHELAVAHARRAAAKARPEAGSRRTKDGDASGHLYDEGRAKDRTNPSSTRNLLKSLRASDHSSKMW